MNGLRYLLFSLLPVLGMSLELLLAYVFEARINGPDIREWDTKQMIVHWIITCILWGFAAFVTATLAKRLTGFDILQKGSQTALWQWAAIAAIVLLSLIVSYHDWNGFKVAKEYNSHGPVRFAFQYIYYSFEVLLVSLVLVYGQKAFEQWFGNEMIPYGGIIIALTWGIAHFFTKDFATGIRATALGLAFGSIYLLAGRSIGLTYLILWIMFVM